MGDLFGAGRLRAAVERRLGDRAGPLVIAAADHPDTTLLDRAEAEAAARSLPFLGVHLELGRAVLGPLVLPGTPGCRTCLDRRRAAADPDAAGDRATVAGPFAVSPFAVDTVAALATDEARLLAEGGTPRTLGAVLTVDDRLLTAVHPLVPDPLCPVCTTPEPDTATELRLESRPKADGGALRVGTVPSGVREYTVDGFAGIVPALFGDDACGLPVSYAPTGWPGRAKFEYGVGRATDRRTSDVAAALEALERRAGMNPTREPVRARFADVAGHALDPRTLGLPEPDSGFPPFDPDRELGWVWGWSFGREAPVLVPRSIAYFGHDHDRPADPAVAYETSNGCALGGCVEEAIVHGLLEVAERDAFLLTWYARRAVPRIDVRSARRPEVPLLAARVERATGYRVHVFDTTADHGIPSVAVLAVDPRPDERRPVVMCAAAAHLDAEQACFAALGELALFVSRHVEDYPAKHEQAAAMAADSDLVRHMDDHALVYGHVSTLPRWDFLLGAGEERTFAEVPTAADLRDDLLGLVARYRDVGLDVVVVDQTGPEQSGLGLSAVKAVVPGALPMTFGHRNRRVRGLPRLDRLTATPNPHPHPFP